MSPTAAMSSGCRVVLAAGVIAVLALAALPKGLAGMGVRTGEPPQSTSPAPAETGGRAPAHVPDEVLVKFRHDLAPERRAALLAPLGLREKRSVGSSGVYLLGITDGSGVAQAIERLRSLPEVAFAEPNAISTVPPLPTPPRPIR